MKHKYYMGIALAAAARAAQRGETPVGAVIVKNGKILAVAGNSREKNTDPTAHAEIVALRQAAQAWGDWRLYGSTVYVTLEPCPMCAGALLQARVKEVYYGACDPKGGAFGSLVDMAAIPGFNHHLEVHGGLMADKAAKQLKQFFRSLR